MDREKFMRRLMSIKEEIEISHGDYGTGEEFEIIDCEGVSTGVIQDQVISTCDYTVDVATLAKKLDDAEYNERSEFQIPLSTYIRDASIEGFTSEEIQKVSEMEEENLENILFLYEQTAKPGEVFWIVYDVSANERSFYRSEREARDAQIMSSIGDSREWDELSDEELESYLQYLPDDPVE